MKLTFKTVQQQTFVLDADPSDTVAALKEKISTSQGHPVASQKIIYSGKILPDAKTVESCSIKEKDFLVLMVSKPKATPATPAPTPVPAPVPAPVATPVAPAPVAPVAAPAAGPTDAVPPPATPAATDSPATAGGAPSQPTSFDSTASFISGSALQSTISNMMEMGFEREQIMKALKASYNNPDRAVEYLMTGIPEHLLAETSAPAPTGPAASVSTPTGGAAPVAAPIATPTSEAPRAAAAPSTGPQNLFAAAQAAQGGGGGGPGARGGLGGLGGAGGGGGGIDPAELAQLRDSPAFQQIRQLVAQNPAYIQPLIQQLAESNPALAQQLASNPEMLYQLLGGEGPGGAGEDWEGGAPPGSTAVQVTEEEAAAIARLQALGFSQGAVIEAFFACGKDENLAANFLFESGEDDDAP